MLIKGLFIFNFCNHLNVWWCRVQNYHLAVNAIWLTIFVANFPRLQLQLNFDMQLLIYLLNGQVLYLNFRSGHHSIWQNHRISIQHYIGWPPNKLLEIYLVPYFHVSNSHTTLLGCFSHSHKLHIFKHHVPWCITLYQSVIRKWSGTWVIQPTHLFVQIVAPSHNQSSNLPRSSH